MGNLLRINPVVLAAAMSALFAASPAQSTTIRNDNSAVGRATNLPVCEWKDPDVATKGVIFAIHGATLYGGRYETIARQFAEQGFPVYALDLRGFGRWQTEPKTFGGDSQIHYTASEHDIVSVLTALHQDDPDHPLYCLGESLGANLAVWTGSSHPELTDGLILVSPCIKRDLHLSPHVAMTFVKGLWHPNKVMDLSRDLKRYLSTDQVATAEYLSDKSMRYRLSPVELVKTIKTNALALKQMNKIPAQMPVLIVAGKKDQVYKTSAVGPFAAKLGSQKKTVDIIADKGHLLVETPRVDPKILGTIESWLDESVMENNERVAVKAERITENGAPQR